MTDDLEVRELRYFQAVAEELNFSRAAERLAMAQPPLSRAIRQLERRLGVPLFERTTHHVTLTPADLTLLEESARVLDATPPPPAEPTVPPSPHPASSSPRNQASPPTYSAASSNSPTYRPQRSS